MRELIKIIRTLSFIAVALILLNELVFHFIELNDDTLRNMILIIIVLSVLTSTYLATSTRKIKNGYETIGIIQNVKTTGAYAGKSPQLLIGFSLLSKNNEVIYAEAKRYAGPTVIDKAKPGAIIPLAYDLENTSICAPSQKPIDNEMRIQLATLLNIDNRYESTYDECKRYIEDGKKTVGVISKISLSNERVGEDFIAEVSINVPNETDNSPDSLVRRVVMNHFNREIVIEGKMIDAYIIENEMNSYIIDYEQYIFKDFKRLSI